MRRPLPATFPFLIRACLCPGKIYSAFSLRPAFFPMIRQFVVEPRFLPSIFLNCAEALVSTCMFPDLVCGRELRLVQQRFVRGRMSIFSRGLERGECKAAKQKTMWVEGEVPAENSELSLRDGSLRRLHLASGKSGPSMQWRIKLYLVQARSNVVL